MLMNMNGSISEAIAMLFTGPTSLMVISNWLIGEVIQHNTRINSLWMPRKANELSDFM